MKYLLNREQIMKSALRGLAEIANDQPIPPASAYYNAELKAKPFDPEKAKFHFQKAGVLGQSIPLITSDAPTAGVRHGDHRPAGRCRHRPQARRAEGPLGRLLVELLAEGADSLRQHQPAAEPRTILFSLLYASDAPWNESQYKNPTFDKMLIEARGSLDQGKRKQIYGEMQKMIAEDAGTAIPVFISNVDAHTSKLKGLRANPLGGMMGYAMAENVWLDA